MSSPSSALPQMSVPPNSNARPTILGIIWAYVAVDILVLIARFYVRLQKRSIGADDWCMLVALGFFIATAAVVDEIVKYGLGRHIVYVPPQNSIPFLKWIFILQSFTFLTLAFAKTSMSLLLLRLLSPQSRWRRWFLWINIILFFIFAILSTIFDLVACKPIEASWNPTVTHASCWPRSVNANWAIFESAYSAFLDFILALLPVTITWKLQLKLKKKVALCLLFSLGILAGVAASIKTAQSYTLSSLKDFSWDAYPLYIWSSTEFFLNIFCGCAPTLKPLYDLWFKGKPIRPSDASGQGASYRVRGMFGSSFGGSNNRSFNFRLLSRNNHSDHLGSDHDNRAWPVPPVDSSIKVEQRVDIDSVPKNYTMPAAANRDMV